MADESSDTAQPVQDGQHKGPSQEPSNESIQNPPACDDPGQAGRDGTARTNGDGLPQTGRGELSNSSGTHIDVDTLTSSDG